MFQQLFNWRALLALIAILIVTGTIFYSRYLAQKIANEERQKVEQWIEAGKFVINSPSDADTKLALMILRENSDVPIIETDERDSITSHVNIDTAAIAKDSTYLRKKLKEFKSQNKPIAYQTNAANPAQRNIYYYGESLLLKEIRYYPIVQLIIVTLFIITTILALRSTYNSIQNQVWAGMAKETAHQLGTPVSSLEGWVEMLKEKPENEMIVHELEKDVNRLRLVSDRFGKIGSSPHLEYTDIVRHITNMVEYIRKRATDKVNFSIDTHEKKELTVLLSAPLFDWVIENLLKNALDAMEGKGSIKIDIQENPHTVNIDVTDTGKGISLQNITKVFKPGFTTKKRGWGLDLSLSKRIVEQYHDGEIFVKNSEPGKGTTFRIVLKK